LSSLAITKGPLTLQSETIEHTLIRNCGHTGPRFTPYNGLAVGNTYRGRDIEHDNVFSSCIADAERIADTQVDVIGAVLGERVQARVRGLRQSDPVAEVVLPQGGWLF